MIYAQNTGLIDAIPSVNIGKAFEKETAEEKYAEYPPGSTCTVNANNAYGKYQYVNAVLVHVAASHHYPPCRSR
jgi:hypothetical protein